MKGSKLEDFIRKQPRVVKYDDKIDSNPQMKKLINDHSRDLLVAQSEASPTQRDMYDERGGPLDPEEQLERGPGGDFGTNYNTAGTKAGGIELDGTQAEKIDLGVGNEISPERDVKAEVFSLLKNIISASKSN